MILMRQSTRLRLIQTKEFQSPPMENIIRTLISTTLESALEKNSALLQFPMLQVVQNTSPSLIHRNLMLKLPFAQSALLRLRFLNPHLQFLQFTLSLASYAATDTQKTSTH